jgi:Beige/BEACH domain/PH domain associated with Beige/BEACH
LEEADKVIMVTLFMPSPAMALLIGATLRNEWSYKDLISDRLQIMMPILPGIVVSLLTHPSDAVFKNKVISKKSLKVLADILTSMGGAFHRVYGGIVHTSPGRQPLKSRGDGSSEAIKAAKTFIPHLITVAMIMENHIAVRTPSQEGDYVRILRPFSGHDVDKPNSVTVSEDSWVDAASSSASHFFGEIIIELPLESELSSSSLVSFLKSCQNAVLNTACGLIANAMSFGGAGAALPLLTSILITLDESVAYAALRSSGTMPSNSISSSSEVHRTSSVDADFSADKDEANMSRHIGETHDVWANALSQSFLCRLISLILLRFVKQAQPCEIWSYELCSAISKLMILMEEKNLLLQPLTQGTPEDSPRLSNDQIVLLCSLLDILAYGRECYGWCQLRLPSMPTVKSSGKSSTDMTANSKLLLPVLLPCLRVVLTSLENIPFSTKIVSAAFNVDNSDRSAESLLGHVLLELDQTLTAAIVGLTFSSARDIALQAMATFRKLVAIHSLLANETKADLFRALFLKVVEELRVRYETERRLRDTALFDAYEEAGDSDAARQVAQESLTVERLILGDVGLGDSTSNITEEIVFNDDSGKSPTKSSMDFVLFHEPILGQKPGGKVGYSHIQGLGSALEECHIFATTSLDTSTSFAAVVSALASFLDAYDTIAEDEAVNSELVKVFDTCIESTSSSPSRMHLPKQLPIVGSEAAADAMGTFFEFAAAEKSRLQELSIRFFPSQRSSRKAFSERFCWARGIEIAPFPIENLWERAVPDGNRDVRSRLPTMPCNPQFRRYLPKYLDNSSERSDSASSVPLESPVKSSLRGSVTAIEIDALTKTLLETGHLEIVDITKKEVTEDEFLEDLQASSSDLVDDDDETALFAESERGESAISLANEEIAASSDLLNVESGSEEMDLTNLRTQTDLSSELSEKWHHSITTSSFSTPPDNSSSSLSLMHSAAAGFVEQHVDNCTHVKAEGNRQCTMLLTSSHLILEYDSATEGLYEGEILAFQEDADRQRRMAEDFVLTKDQNPDAVNQQIDEKLQREVAMLRPKSIRWNLSEISHVYLRRYRLRDSALELFVIPTGGTSFGGFGLFSSASSLFLDFGSGYEGSVRRDEAAKAIMRRVPAQAVKQWPESSDQFLHDQLSRLTIGWVEGRITNFDYLLHLNILSGRSYNDTCQYPVFPWVLANYTSEEIPDLTDRSNFRDLSKPVGALNPDRLKDFIERFNTFADPSIPPFMYGSHYSTSAGVVLHFLVRMHPFAGLHRQLQGGHFDVADRLFSSVPRTWSMCTGSSAAEVKELTPEWYCNPSFLRNENNFKLGTTQDGEIMGDVVLPPWAKGSPEKFVEVMRAALESDICSEMISDWIDLIFGRKQQGPESVKAHNVFFYLTYYGTVDVASIEDEALRKATELQIAHFGQCPMQLFKRPHIRRLPRNYFNLSVYQVLSAFTQRQAERKNTESGDGDDLDELARTPSANRAHLHSVFGDPVFLPFLSAPLSHWVHSSAPPPGPHSALVAVRLSGVDRCVAIDEKGIYHFFRWAWRSDDVPPGTLIGDRNFDSGCFVAQRELPRFRSVPRLMYSPQADDSITVAISKTLFANRSVLLVLSNGDAFGSLCMQLVDPVKGDVRGEVLVPQVHAARITCIATDAIGTAAGHGGVGGELAVVGSADGNASVWRFMSSHYLPLRPRGRLQGHKGAKLLAVALCSSIHVAVTLSRRKCCIHAVGNGTLTRSFTPPQELFEIPGGENVRLETQFADTGALAVSVQGFVITVCETIIRSSNLPERTVISLHLFTVEGVSLGSTPLETWRGVPHKMYCTPDGTTVMVCCGRGVTMYRLSACQPLKFLDEFQVTESDDFGSSSFFAAWDLDLGPALHRPVVAVAACTNGALRLHALPGISAWSERHKKSGLIQTAGSALASPARRLTSAVREGLGFGRQLAGMGRDLQREVATDVKERGVGGFLGNVMSRMSNNK